MSLMQEVIEQYCQVDEKSETPRRPSTKSAKKGVDTFDTGSPERFDISNSPLVKSVDEWSKRLQKSPEKLRQAAGDDWEEMSADIIGFADALAVNQIRESGAIPSSYTSETFCRKCNCYVPFYEGVPEIGSCSWCRNGKTPPPIPEISE